MSIRLLDWRLRGALVEARIPFRFGIAEMNELVHAVLFVTVEVDGKRETGVAADNLAAEVVHEESRRRRTRRTFAR